MIRDDMFRVSELATLARLFRLLFIKRLHFIDDFSWDEYFSSNQRTLFVINHGPACGPALFHLGIIPRLEDMGYGDLTYCGIVHQMLFNLPGGPRYGGIPKKGKKRYSVEDYVQVFEKEGLDTLVVAPEGEHCIYGNGLDIQPFRSPRSLEIALRAGCRIVLVMGKGFELWQKNVCIKDLWKKQLIQTCAEMLPRFDNIDEELLLKSDALSVQLMPWRVPDFHIYTQHFVPELKAGDLARDLTKRRAQLWIEADRMRAQMQKMVDELKCNA